MKKIFLSLFVILSIICLTGCGISEKDVNGIFKTLQKDKIVSKDLKQIDKVTMVNAGIIASKTTYYIYKDSNSNLIAINYDANMNSNGDYDYCISIYSDVSIDDDITYIEDTSLHEYYYIYQDNRKSMDGKYSFKDRKDYLIKKTKNLFSGAKYNIEKK